MYGNRFACVRQFAGVPICCVERWNLIRRLMVINSPVYADSPVRQSVGWTLESDTPIYGNRFACVRRFAGVPICCVERLNPIRRFAGNRFACVRRFAGTSSLFCRNVGSCYFAGTPLRRRLHLLLGTSEVWSSKPGSSR